MIAKCECRLLKQMAICLGLIGISLCVASCGPGARPVDFLASWSPDGAYAALVPNFLEDEKSESGVWILDSGTGKTRQIVAVPKDLVCVHPQWSPSGNELLLAILKRDEDGAEDKGRLMPYSVFVVGPDGRNLREVAQAATADGSAFLARNAVSWGPKPDTIILQVESGESITAAVQNLRTGQRRQYLPGSSDSYATEISPDRQGVAAILYDEGSGLGKVYVADISGANWRLLDTLSIDPHRVENFNPLIFWSPDSSQFAVPESDSSMGQTEQSRGFVRVFQPERGVSRRVCSGNPTSAILWNRESTSIVFSDERRDDEVLILRVDLSSDRESEVAAGGNDHLLAWNFEDNRIYFFRTYKAEKISSGENRIAKHRLFSCSEDGAEARTIGRFSTEETPFWTLSPMGNRLVIFNTSTTGAMLNLTTGASAKVPLISVTGPYGACCRN